MIEWRAWNADLLLRYIALSNGGTANVAPTADNSDKLYCSGKIGWVVGPANYCLHILKTSWQN